MRNNNNNNDNFNKLSMRTRKQRLKELQDWVDSIRPLVTQLQQGEKYTTQSSVCRKTWKKQVEEKMNEFAKWRKYSFPGLIIEEGKETEIIESRDYKVYERFLRKLEDTMIEAAVCLSLLEQYLSQTRRSKLH